MDLLTYTEAAARAGVGEQTIRRRVKDRSLPEIMDGSRPKVRLDDLQKLYPSIKMPSVRECRIIAFSNQKGGVGKTTTCANLATVFAKTHRVLAIDCDPQGNLTQAFGQDPDSLVKTTYNVLVEKLPIEKASFSPIDEIPQLHLLGANLDLAEAEQKLMGAVAGEMRLRQAIDPIQHLYDFILVDSPPSLGVLTMNALAAATDVIIPVNVGSFSLRAVTKLMTIIAEVQTLNPNLRSIRPVTNERDNTNLQKDLRIALENAFKDQLFKTTIRKAQIVKDDQARGIPVTLKQPQEPVSVDYHSLAAEFMGEPFQEPSDLDPQTQGEVNLG